MTGKVQGLSTNVEASKLPQREAVENQVQPNTVFNFENNVKNDKVAENKPLKTTDLNYQNFKKADRDDAMSKARDAMNEIRDLLRDYNANFPAKAYVADFASFPRPEDYNGKQLGGKHEAFTQWENDVDDWKENIKQDVAQLKSNNIDNLAKQQFKALEQIYINQGLTQAFIKDCYERHNHNLQETKEELNQSLEKAKRNINNNTNTNNRELEHTVKDSEENLHYNIHAHHVGTRTVVQDEANRTRYTVETEAAKTRRTEKQEGRKTRNKIDDLRKDIETKMQKNNIPRSRLRDLIKKFNGTLIDLQFIPIDVLEKILQYL